MTVAEIFSRESTNSAVAIAAGYGVRVHVLYGQLTIQDGVGRSRRERRFPKADRTLKRIVIAGQTGYITLGALKWCAEHSITITTLDPDGDLIAHHSSGDPAPVKLLRAQVLADGTPLELDIAREIESRKLHGQAANLESLFDDFDGASRVRKLADGMVEARNGNSLRGTEGKAAGIYFDAWRLRVAPQWDAKALARIPANWKGFPGRSSPIRKGAGHRVATDPVNALLNYGYAIGLSEARTACIAVGLDPRIGFVHVGRSVNLVSRDSLALDLLEVIRPTIDAHVIGMVRDRAFTWRDFAEPYGFEPGTCRVVAPLTHELIEASYGWSAAVVDAAGMVVSLLGA